MRLGTWIFVLTAPLFACTTTTVFESAPPPPPDPTGDAATADPDSGTVATDPDAGVEAGPIAIGPAGNFEKNVTIDSVARTYLLYVPTSAVTAMKTGPVPILVGFHGAGDTADNFVAASDFKTAADANGFVVLAPNAYDGGGGGAWFLHDNEGWPGADGSPTSSLRNDIHLVLQILKDTSAAYRIDPKRTYACGFSRGAGFTGGWAIMSNNAQFTSLSGITAPQSPFAAYAISAGFDMFGGQVDSSKSSPKRPVWIMHGTADQGVPFSMGQGLATSLQNNGWTVTFTSITNAPHDWLWRPVYQHSNQELWTWFLANPMP